MTYRRHLLALALAPLVLAGCDEATGPEESSARVRVAFTTSPTALRSAGGASLSTSPAAREQIIVGTNGTLTLTNLGMIVSEFELEGPEACAGADDEGEAELEECEFEAAPFLLDLPLDGGQTVVATGEVPLGTYSQLKFEVEDLEEDDDDEARTRQAIVNLRSQLSAAYPGFPSRASMVVRGAFTPTGGAARPFLVFVDADVDVEIELSPPLVIDEAGASRTLSVQLDPARWFMQGRQVVDLSRFNGTLLELEDEFELGVEGVEVDDD